MELETYRVLNKLKWSGMLKNAIIYIVERRGKEEHETKVRGKDLIEISKTYFLFISREGKEKLIPMHRIRGITVGKKTLWKKQN